jgi:transposase
MPPSPRVLATVDPVPHGPETFHCPGQAHRGLLDRFEDRAMVLLHDQPAPFPWATSGDERNSSCDGRGPTSNLLRTAMVRTSRATTGNLRKRWARSRRTAESHGTSREPPPPPQPEALTKPPSTTPTEEQTASKEDPPGANASPQKKRRAIRPAPSTYTLRLEYAPEVAGDLPTTDDIILPNWSRDFSVSGKYTLEQLSEIMLGILGWDQDHLYEFRIVDRVHIHMVFLGEDDLFVDTKHPCVSCDIPIRLLGLSVADVFSYIFDFGDYHTFRITVLDIQAVSNVRPAPALLSYRGKNIIQYPGTMRKAEARAFERRPPTIEAPEPSRSPSRIRFIRGDDGRVLKDWRASNNKKLWQKAVAILESRNLSLENIAAKIERPEGDVQKWIKAFNRRGLDGLKRPEGHRGYADTTRRGKRQIGRAQKARRIFEIIHAKPNAYGINRSNWSLPSIARAFEQEHKETVSTGTVGRLLRQFGYAIRKARKVLTSPDPDYREKVDLLLRAPFRI